MTTNRPPCPICDQQVLIFKNGSYELADHTVIQRWFCQKCRKSFSPATVRETPAANSEASATHPKYER
ncbi:hypothetical protein NSTC731_03153 [Nostoc sp. DSM 114167]|jgi:transposase-like protein